MKYFVIIYTAKPKGESGETCISTYNLDNACKRCGTGARLIDNLISKGLSSIKTHFFATLSGDFLISNELYKFLIDKGIKLKSLKKVVDSKRKETTFYHLYTEISFPKSLPSSEGLVTERQCQVCKRNGYFNDVKIGDYKKGIPTVIVPLKLIYQGINKDFLESSERFNTWEHFGLSNLKAEGMKVVRYARPMLIVSERIKLAFEEYKVKDAKFAEIILI